jgi:transposase
MPSKVDPKTQQRVVKLYRAGLTLKEIEAKVGVKSTSARAVLQEHGVPRRPKGRQVRLRMPERLQRRVIALYEEGWSGRKISEWLKPLAGGGSYETVYKLLRDRGVPRRSRGQKKKMPSPHT